MKPSYEDMLVALKRLADPEDVCHHGYGGPWQDVAQVALFGRTVDNDEWWGEYGRFTVEQMMERIGDA